MELRALEESGKTRPSGVKKGFAAATMALFWRMTWWIKNPLMSSSLVLSSGSSVGKAVE